MPACGRCSKAGQAASCLYIDDAVDTPNKPATLDPVAAAGGNSRVADPGLDQSTSGDLLSRLEYQDRRIKQLEAALTRDGQSQNPNPDPVQRLKFSDLPPTPEPNKGTGGIAATYGAIITARESTILRGKSFKTQFMGTTCTGGLICHMPELNIFTREAFEKFPALARIRHDMHALYDKVNGPVSQPGGTTGERLKALLPSQDEVDYQVQLYFDTYGSIYHVLHLPSFQQEYDELWKNLDAASAPLVATLLLMMASVQCLASKQWLYAASSSTARERSIAYITAVETWLEDQSQKHVTAADFQIRFLLLLTKQVTARKFKRAWTDAGTFVRFCMSAGLHRNPELIRKQTSALNKELRRRIWAAAIEIDLQTSLDRGMVPHNWTLQADCSAPGNIRDEVMDTESEQRAAQRPSREFTYSSYLTVASESVALRHMLTTTLNNIRQMLTFEDVKRYTEEITRHIESIPEWADDSSQVACAHLTLNLRQYLLVLHDRQLRQAESTAERNFSRMILLDTSHDIVTTHQSLIKAGIYALEVLCNDLLRAALSVTRVATTLDPKSDMIISQAIEQSTSKMVDDVIEMLTDKVVRFGREQRQLWVSLAAHGYLKSKKDPTHRSAYMQEAVDKVTRPYYKIMACQEDVPSTADLSGPPTIRSAGQEEDGRRVHDDPFQNPADIAAKNAELNALDMPLLDLDEIAAWTFEDWSFNPGDLRLQQPAYGETYEV